MCLTPPSDTGSGASSVTRERNSCNKGTAAAEFGWSLYSVCLANEFATETKLRYRKKSKHGEAVQNTSIGRPALLPSEHVDRLECPEDGLRRGKTVWSACHAFLRSTTEMHRNTNDAAPGFPCMLRIVATGRHAPAVGRGYRESARKERMRLLFGAGSRPLSYQGSWIKIREILYLYIS